jgi:short-subunit dehydrogenase
MPHALVTGATEGIGLAFARQLARRGCDLVLVARTQGKLNGVAEELGSACGCQVETIAADLATERGCAAVEARIAAGIRILVNNAGIGVGGSFTDTAIEDEERLLRLNIRAVLRLTHAALPGMLARNTGAIINVASVAAYGPVWPASSYPASKAWALNFTESLAWSQQLRHSRVRIMALLPGYTRTRFHASAGIPTHRIPRWMWLDPDQVVRKALADLARGRRVSIPTLRYKLLANAVRHLPRALTVPCGLPSDRGQSRKVAKRLPARVGMVGIGEPAKVQVVDPGILPTDTVPGEHHSGVKEPKPRRGRAITQHGS